MIGLFPSDGVEKVTKRPWWRGFRAKFFMLVGGAVAFDLIAAGGVALWNLNALSRDAKAELEVGLTSATQEYLDNLASTTAIRVNVALDRIDSEVSMLAAIMQGFIDRDTATLLATPEVSQSSELPLVNLSTGWAQNAPGATSVVSVWSYLVDGQTIRPEAKAEVARSAIFDVFAAKMLPIGAEKLQFYYVGPKSAPIMRTVPYTDQAQTFDRLYPGHDETNFWDFFFPGAIEGWDAWLADPASQPVATSQVTVTAPYVDAITGNLIVSFFHPLWTKPRDGVAGMTAADITLDQLSNIVEGVHIAENGFAFLSLSNGNLIAASEEGLHTLGLDSSTSVIGAGVTGIERALPQSTEPEIANLAPPTGETAEFRSVLLGPDRERHIVVLHRLAAMNFWEPGGLRSERPILGFVVPESEVYATLERASVKVAEAKDRIVTLQGIVLAASLVVVLTAVFGISTRVTAGLTDLAAGARRLRNRDYSVRITVRGRDEVADVGLAFNRMAEDIDNHTTNLEGLVTERNNEILKLNDRLRSENNRLSAEIDVARQVQMMVLPGSAEAATVPGWDIACHMAPADEVGGDYYDILAEPGRLKVGIGDVTGHGLHSGVVMLMVQSLVRGLFESGERDPATFLSVLNRALTKNIQRSGSDKHMTIAFLDITDDGVVLSGQHEEIIILRADGSNERIDTIDLGFPLGLEMEIGAFIASQDLSVASGDVILLFTDGITEAVDPGGAFYGIDRMICAARSADKNSAAAVRDAVLEHLDRFIDGGKVHDDITLVVLRKE